MTLVDKEAIATYEQDLDLSDKDLEMEGLQVNLNFPVIEQEQTLTEENAKLRRKLILTENELSAARKQLNELQEKFYEEMGAYAWRP